MEHGAVHSSVLFSWLERDERALTWLVALVMLRRVKRLAWVLSSLNFCRPLCMVVWTLSLSSEIRTGQSGHVEAILVAATAEESRHSFVTFLLG